MQPISELIAAWQAKTITGAALLRALIAHPSWDVPVSDEAVGLALAENRMPSWQLSLDRDGKRCLPVFSSRESYAAFQESGPPRQQHFIGLPGTAVFANTDGIDRLVIDPGSAHEIWYGPGQFERLHVYLAAMAVEEALVTLRAGTSREGAIELVRRHPSYSIPVVITDGHERLLFAPDSRGRKLAAIFTAGDAFEAFTPDAEQQAHGNEVQQWQVSGVQMFSFLQELEIDGFVFNCAGPTASVAFGQAMAKVVVEA